MSRLPALGIRSSAIPTWLSSRKPRRSPPISRGLSVWQSRCTEHTGSRWTASGPRTRWCCARSETLQPTTPPPPAQSTPLSPRPIGACRCRFCLSARTTASAFRCRRRLAGSRRHTGLGPGLTYLSADGADPAAAWPAIVEAVNTVREQRRPVFLHLRTVRFGGHAGSDAEISYRKPREIEADYARDPLLATASCLRATGATTDDILARYNAIRRQIDDEAERLASDATTQLGGRGHGTHCASQPGPSRGDGSRTEYAALSPSTGAQADLQIPGRVPSLSRSTPRWTRCSLPTAE